MKKFVIGLLALCLVIVGVVGLSGAKTRMPASALPSIVNEDETVQPEAVVGVIGGEDGPTAVYVTGGEEDDDTAEAISEAAMPAPAEEPTEELSTVPEEAAVASGRLNYEALFALHDPDEKVLAINNKEEKWGDYFYVLFTQCGQIEDYFDAMAAYYGEVLRWNDPIEEDSEETFASMALDTADSLMIQLAALEAFAEENDVVISEELKDTIEAQMAQDVISALGEDGTKEEFLEYLAGIHLSEEMYERIVTQNFLYQESFNKLYGEDAAKLPDATALKYLKDNGYVSAAHILFLNSDPETMEPLEEDALQARKAELEAVLQELRDIEDPQARKEAFLQKITELSEDTGKVYYPEGYTYTPGTMVPEFEEAAGALEDYAISDVVETDYGYHIIMRLPLSPDAVVELSSSTAAPRTARMLAANQEYAGKLQATADALTLEWLPGCERPNLLAFVAE